MSCQKVAGVQVTRPAEMKSIAVTNTHPREKLAQADLVVNSLEAVDTDVIEKLLCSS